MNGFEVLRWLREQNLKDLTVIVLSTSILPDDIETAKALGAHEYVIKDRPRATAEAIASILLRHENESGAPSGAKP